VPLVTIKIAYASGARRWILNRGTVSHSETTDYMCVCEGGGGVSVCLGVGVGVGVCACVCVHGGRVVMGSNTFYTTGENDNIKHG